VAPNPATLVAGGTIQLSATTRDAANNVLTGRVVTWSSDNSTIAAVSPTGLVTAVSQGGTTVRATSEGVTGTSTVTVSSPPPPNGIVDPTLLVKATGQHPATGTYGRSLAAGQTYVDPLTGVTVLKLTDASSPQANSGIYHGYSEGGPILSQPWVGTDGHTYYTAIISAGWLVDIRYDTFAPSNWRAAPTDGETRGAFSLNPATPRILYYVEPANDKTVHRYDTAINANAEQGIFPYTPSSGSRLQWLQVNLNDQWLVGLLGTTTVGVRLSDGLERVIPAGTHDVDEPHLDREFPVVYISTNDINNWIINLETGATVAKNDPGNVDAADHEAPLRGRIVVVNYVPNGIVSTDYQGNVAVAFRPSPTDWSGDFHMAAQWVFNNPNQYFVIDQWKSAGNFAIYKGMIGFASLAGDVRLIAAHDATGISYDTGGQPHPTLSPDGKLVMWTSNMNGSSRFDVFVARVPVR
jgi:hypothetical protein